MFWYAPGATVDKVWLHRAGGGYSSLARQVAGTYRWSVGDLDGDGRDDIIWYAPGTATDSVFYGAPEAEFGRQALTINGDYTPIVADLDGSGRDGLILYGLGSGTDHWFRWSVGAGGVPHQPLPAGDPDCARGRLQRWGSRRHPLVQGWVHP